MELIPSSVMETAAKSKVCGTCRQDLPLIMFGVSLRHKYGVHSRCKQCQKDAGKRWYDTKGWAYKLNKRYGIDAEGYNTLFAAQDSRCAICRESYTGRLFVDHDHQTQMVRGLLCPDCNRAVRALEKDKDWAAKALEYLREVNGTDRPKQSLTL